MPCHRVSLLNKFSWEINLQHSVNGQQRNSNLLVRMPMSNKTIYSLNVLVPVEVKAETQTLQIVGKIGSC